MNAATQIISQQIEWANNRGLQLVGSHGHLGLKAYTTSIEANLFQPLNEQTRNEIGAGDGGELNGSEGQPAKIQALHSSSALGVNVFDFWRGKKDLSILTAACGLTAAGHEVAGEIRFEQKFSIDHHFQYSPNLDVIIYPQSSTYAAFGIECKFTEAYSSRGHGGLDPKYLGNDAVWHHLPATRGLAQEISPVDNRFKHLHAAQLIKHILGLNRRFGHGRYRLLYLWYDALGEPGAKHRQEIYEFLKIAHADSVKFHQTSYQELILRLAKHRESHPDYVAYLTARYL
jgi:hypothetical protein